ncbi:MAG: glycoside hydrolase family 13 protein [Rhodothermales bacterium]|nr:glycoside hydrolase family 13 protein [Rhodothermales bacterium]
MRKPETPDWVKNAVFYQIFPDRFARSKRLKHPASLRFKPWGSPPAEQGYQGGDLLGVVDRLDHLQQVGVTALYLNPIFSSASNHRYHTFDYYQVDPLLGGNDALRELIDVAHAKGMRVILDGVFNHASRGFWPFHHILENGPSSPYIDWFVVKNWPLNPYPRAVGEPLNYEAWWNLPALPCLNTRNLDVQEYIFSVATHWLEFGIDGWRLDVPAEIDDDVFWQTFRKRVRAVNPEAYICGEIWEDARRWLKGDQFDAVMNYIFTWAVLSFCGAETLRPDYNRNHLSLEPRDAPAFAEAIEAMHGLYDWEINQAQLNLIGSHDMARPLWIVGDDPSAIRLSAFLQMTMPGAPCIYYGDEIGLSAGDDPDCRGAFPWDERKRWNRDILEAYTRLCALRHQWPVLRTGTFEQVLASGRVYGFRRRLDGVEALVFINTGRERVVAELPLDNRAPVQYRCVWPADVADIDVTQPRGELSVVLPEREGVVLITSTDRSRA